MVEYYLLGPRLMLLPPSLLLHGPPALQVVENAIPRAAAAANGSITEQHQHQHRATYTAIAWTVSPLASSSMMAADS